MAVGVGRQRQRAPEVLLGDTVLAQLPVDDAEIDLEIGIVGPQRRGALEVVSCRRIVAARHQRDAVVHQAARVERALHGHVVPQRLFAAPDRVALPGSHGVHGEHGHRRCHGDRAPRRH